MPSPIWGMAFVKTSGLTKVLSGISTYFYKKGFSTLHIKSKTDDIYKY